MIFSQRKLYAKASHVQGYQDNVTIILKIQCNNRLFKQKHYWNVSGNYPIFLVNVLYNKTNAKYKTCLEENFRSQDKTTQNNLYTTTK
jgi:hypothetical protein